MTEATSWDLIKRLENGFVALIAALDGQDADAIIDAAAALRPLMAEVENTGAWRDDEAIRLRVENLSKLISASRYRVNKLTDLNRQRAGNLTAAIAMRGISNGPSMNISRTPL